MLKFSKEQRYKLSDYFADISKLAVGSAVVGYLIPAEILHITGWGFIAGLFSALIFLFGSMYLVK